ncbi:hypothetical protein, partial [Priestia megaterium]|uniref:hypothetical protein n=1 Tax=Priestia megaterium TaxID=1404 RepID=UPI00300BB8EB
EIFRWGFEKYGRNQIQTNGILINNEHIRLFQKYKVNVGISIDGPDELNDLRWQFSLKRTRENTQKTLSSIYRLCKEGLAPGLIITLHKINASIDRLPHLLNWIRKLDEIGVPSIRIHLLEVESELIRQRYSLTDEENINCLLKLSDLQEELKQLRLDVMDEMTNLLLGKDRTTSCVWHSCDSYTTQAVRGIEGTGHSSNCGRTNKDGVDFIKASKNGFERYIALYHTPQEYGGCNGCRFFAMCKGQCPGTALNGDWRNRSELCNVWKAVFSHLEEKLIEKGEKPLSLQPETIHYIEEKLLAHWKKGIQTTIESILMSKPLSNEATPQIEENQEFQIPSFTRYAFVGENQRLRWESRIISTRFVLAKIGALTVANELASLSLVRVPTNSLFEFHQYAAQLGFHSKVLSRGKSDLFERVIVGRFSDLNKFDLAYKKNNWKMIHKLLGIPSCCSNEMLNKTQEGFNPVLDLITPLRENLQQESDINCSKVLNVLLRPLGIDLLGYQPCSFQCKHSENIGESKLLLGKEAALGKEIEWLEEMLEWPAEWTSLHGIAELKTGIFKISSNSFPTHNKITLRYHGQKMALDAVQGLSFAYKKV